MAVNCSKDNFFEGLGRVACVAGRTLAAEPKYLKYFDSCLVLEIAMRYRGEPPLAPLFDIGAFDAQQEFYRVARTYELRPGHGTEAPARGGATIQCGGYADLKGWAASDSMKKEPHLGLSGFSKEAGDRSECGRSEHMGGLALAVYVIIGGAKILGADLTFAVSGATNSAIDLDIATRIVPSAIGYIEERLGKDCCVVEFPGQENARLAIVDSFKGE